MAQNNLQDKTEQATPKRREEARKKGQVAKSRELSSITILSTGLLYLFFLGENTVATLGTMIHKIFLSIPHFTQGSNDLIGLFMQSITRYLWITLPMMLVLCVVSLLANLLQTGFVLSVEPLAPKASKINPIQGLAKILSKRSLVELVKSIAKVLIVGWAAFSTLRDMFSHLIPLMYQGEGQILTTLGQASLKVMIRCCWVLAILAILDYLYQKWEFAQNLKMTKQEVKDEFKQTEGDPLVKSRIKSLQREMARRRMMEEIPKADVVITNPTHLAIALRYDALTMVAPTVIAKGADRIAQRIKALAEENKIPVIENRGLAQNLYKLDIGEGIPQQFYLAVAEILAYVYNLKKQRA